MIRFSIGWLLCVTVAGLALAASSSVKLSMIPVATRKQSA
jgi:hypothetical protein